MVLSPFHILTLRFVEISVPFLYSNFQFPNQNTLYFYTNLNTYRVILWGKETDSNYISLCYLSFLTLSKEIVTILDLTYHVLIYCRMITLCFNISEAVNQRPYNIRKVYPLVGYVLITVSLDLVSLNERNSKS